MKKVFHIRNKKQQRKYKAKEKRCYEARNQGFFTQKMRLPKIALCSKMPEYDVVNQLDQPGMPKYF